ncbi:DNA cytosine methyltransferase [Streptococcus sanguinis]|uniref:DNA cytosine methyltransferase n=1 Tax=Streptococcus sanguinis TaxID=1305 RepID=UPI000F681A27|nr:DNA cytosine methyltransferase [Streptococcus sanguinis]RSI51556.1 Modification methylase HhaI [Streptococcus sanguinis]
MKFLDLFAGIGGFRLGMEAAGHECVGFCEIDKFARKSYKAIHDTKGEIELHDITAVSDDTVRGIGRVDVICGGFPCQAFSIAGKRQGFEDTRGTLFFEIARFASILRPRLLFLENVKGLLNHDGGNTFETIIATLDELGYDVEWQVLNSKNFGVPQNRERVFIIGHLRGASTRGVFPFGGNDKENSGNDIIQINDSKKIREQLKYENIWRVVDTKGIAPTLDTMQGGNREPKIIQRGHGYNQGGEYEIAPTLTSNSYHENNHLLNGFRIRKLTPRECWRLQGFPDWAFDKAQEVNSNSQLYKQAGNSVTVNVIAAIAKELK